MDALALWGYSRDAEILVVDFGTVPRRSSDELQVRVKNLSTSYTATDVVVSIVGALDWHYYLSLDDDVFTATVELGDLAPGDLSDGITVRRVTPTTAPLGEHTVDIRATPASWITATA